LSKETNQVEDIFREAFEKYEVDPGSNAWQAIQSKMAAEGAAASSAASTTAAASSSSWVATAIVATVISATAIGGYFFFNDTAEKIKGKTQQTESKEKIEPTESIDSQTKNKEVAVDSKTNQLDVNAKNEVSTVTNKSIAQENQVTKQKDDSKSIADKKVSNKTAPNTSDKDLKENEEAEEIADITDNQSANLDKEQTSSTTDIEKSVVEENKGLPAKEKNEVEKEPSVSNTTSPSEKTHESEVEPPNYTSLPNVFTPNQDGRNDELEISIEDFDKFHIQIFTKSGQKVFESVDINDRWKGDLPSGSAAPNGFYVYQIVVEKDGKSFPKTGSVSLKR
jgi:gliding motility-associated-like protein